MGNVITNLKAKFGVDASDFKKGLKEGGDSLADLDRRVGRSVNELKGLLTPLALLGAAGGAIATMKNAIESVEGPGDRFEAVIAGSKEALFEFNRALASLDFSNFLSDITEGYLRGKEFAEALDQLADRSAYNDYRIAQLNRESEALQEVVKDKQLELSERAAAAEKVKDLEAKIVARRIELAKEEFEIAKAQWEERNKLEADEAIKLYETVDALAPDIKKRLQDAFTSATSTEMGSVKRGIEIVTRGLSGDRGLYEAVSPEVIQSYAQFFRLMENGERDVLIKLFNTFKDIDEKGYQAQKEYNSIIKTTSTLLKQEAEDLGKVNTESQKQADLLKAAADLEKQKATNMEGVQKLQGNQNLPDLGFDIDKVMPKVYQVQKATSDVVKNIQTEIGKGVSDLTDSMLNFSASMLMGQGSAQSFVEMVSGSFAQIGMNVAKIAIKSAPVFAAIDAAMKNPANWPLLLLAGGALMAISAIMRKSLANAASSDGGSAFNGAGSSLNSPGSYTYDTRQPAGGQPITVMVKGRIELQGKTAAVIIENENNRRNSST